MKCLSVFMHQAHGMIESSCRHTFRDQPFDKKLIGQVIAINRGDYYEGLADYILSWGLCKNVPHPSKLKPGIIGVATVDRVSQDDENPWAMGPYNLHFRSFYSLPLTQFVLNNQNGFITELKDEQVKQIRAKWRDRVLLPDFEIAGSSTMYRLKTLIEKDQKYPDVFRFVTSSLVMRCIPILRDNGVLSLKAPTKFIEDELKKPERIDQLKTAWSVICNVGFEHKDSIVVKIFS